MRSKVYDKIYFPHYSSDIRIGSSVPEIYNKSGKQMDVFFIRDSNSCHTPYGEESKYFLWDRFNIGLSTHFYTHKSILETMGNPDRQYGMFIEPRSVTPNDYNIFNRNGLSNKFTNIITFDEQLLNKLPNAIFFPFGVSFGDVLSKDAYSNKNKDISIICSRKKFTKHHKLRHQCANIIKREKVGDVYGGFDGSKWLESKIDSLRDYRYQVVVENGVFDYYFTEKIMDCFVSMTIPVYLGARKIGDFFNMDGIIVINEKDIDNLPKILQQCNKTDYESRLPAIKDNYYRALEYRGMSDKFYEVLFLK
jgi:hypothetical protein